MELKLFDFNHYSPIFSLLQVLQKAGHASHSVTVCHMPGGTFK